jgi:hypothetical protein
MATKDHHRITGDQSATPVIVLLTIGFDRRRKWCAEVWKGERKLVGCLLSLETSSSQRSLWPESHRHWSVAGRGEKGEG